MAVGWAQSSDTWPETRRSTAVLTLMLSSGVGPVRVLLFLLMKRRFPTAQCGDARVILAVDLYAEREITGS